MLHILRTEVQKSFDVPKGIILSVKWTESLHGAWIHILRSKNGQWSGGQKVVHKAAEAVFKLITRIHPLINHGASLIILLQSQ